MDIYEVKFTSRFETDSALAQITFIEGDSLTTTVLTRQNKNEEGRKLNRKVEFYLYK